MNDENKRKKNEDEDGVAEGEIIIVKHKPLK